MQRMAYMQDNVRRDRHEPAISYKLDIIQILSLITIGLLLFSGIWFDIFISPVIIAIGNYNFSVYEPVFIVSSISAMIGLLRNRSQVGSWIFPILILNSIFLWDLFRGVLTNPVLAITSLRADGSFPPLLLLAACTKFNERYFEIVSRLLRIAALFVTGLLLVRKIISPDIFMIAGGLAENEGRALSVRGATILAIALGIVVARFLVPTKRKRTDLPLAILFLATIFVSAQGTASICALAIVLLTIVFNTGTFYPIRVAVFAVLSGTIGILYTLSDDIFTRLTGDEFLMHRLENVQTRVEIWRAGLAEFAGRNYLEWLIGLPVGYHANILIGLKGRIFELTVSFHSMYIGVLSNFGLIGAISSGVIVASIFYRLLFSKRFPAYSAASQGLCLGLLVAGCLLAYTYEIRNEGLLFVLIPFVAINRNNTQDQNFKV